MLISSIKDSLGMPDEEKIFVIESAQLDHLLSINLSTVIAPLFLSLLLVYIQRDLVALSIMLAWLFLMILTCVIRLILAQYFIKNPANDYIDIHRRLNILRTGLVVTSILWGCNVFIVSLMQQFEHQLFVCFLLMGLSAGAAVSYSIDRISALAYILFAVIPFTIWFGLKGGEVPTAISVAGITYIVFISFSVIKFNQKLLEGVILSHEADKHRDEIKHLAFNDVLTNLPNRRLLQEHLKETLAASKETNEKGALLFIDLDHFKTLNDTLGHDMGDLLLVQVSERLKQSVRDADMVSRLGGDEFVIMLSNLGTDLATAEMHVETISNKMLARLNEPYQLDSFEYQSTPSIGIAMFGQHGETHEDLLKHADIAMYHAKKSGRNVVSMFDHKMREGTLK
jgi:diguanylate cyclase (GGDEF)-like protein